jgi:hypothetical protein
MVIDLTMPSLAYLLKCGAYPPKAVRFRELLPAASTIHFLSECPGPPIV